MMKLRGHATYPFFCGVKLPFIVCTQKYVASVLVFKEA